MLPEFLQIRLKYYMLAQAILTVMMLIFGAAMLETGFKSANVGPWITTIYIATSLCLFLAVSLVRGR